MTEKLYAFWQYDFFPYVSGGSILSFNKDGRVECGTGFYYKPILVVPEKTGREIKERLAHLEHDYREALGKVKVDFNKVLAKEFPELVKK